MMALGETDEVVNLGILEPSPHLFGVGALAHLKGEITIVGGKQYLSYPREGNSETLVRENSSEGAALLVCTSVEKWQSIQIDTEVPFDQLDMRLAEIVRSAGFAEEARVPFLIEGVVEDLEWHVIDGSKIPEGASDHHSHRASGIRHHKDKTAATLIGFFSRSDQGVFTHMDSTTHIHCVLDDPLSSGHVDKVTIPAGTAIKFPVLKSNS